MKNQILKSGDFVKYHRQDDALDVEGFELGNAYEVRSDSDGLFVSQGTSEVYLTFKGELTDNSDYFAKVRAETNLPKGLSL